MPKDELLRRLVRRNLQLEKLRYKAPGPVPTTIIDLIRAHKPALVQHLQAQQAATNLEPTNSGKPQGKPYKEPLGTLEDLRQLVNAGKLDGRPLVVLGYPHPNIGRVIREQFGHVDNAEADGLNPGYFENRLREIQRALESEVAA